MPTVSQHYGHHAVPGAVDETRTRQQAAPVVLMVSGGADSTALLLMACTSKLDIQDGRGVAPIARERLHVLHVNHHLRGKASDGDEAFVRELCAQYGLPLCVEHAYFDGESVSYTHLDVYKRQSENAGMSSERRESNSSAVNPRFPGQG